MIIPQGRTGLAAQDQSLPATCIFVYINITFCILCWYIISLSAMAGGELNIIH